jgi:DNA-directed RNA polymerase subunit RPC12/RpoP
MQTITFQCGRCGKLIAVGGDNLSRRVRCPYCRGVVLATWPVDVNTTPVPESTSPPVSGEIVTPALPASVAPVNVIVSTTEPENNVSPSIENSSEPGRESIAFLIADVDSEETPGESRIEVAPTLPYQPADLSLVTAAEPHAGRSAEEPSSELATAVQSEASPPWPGEPVEDTPFSSAAATSGEAASLAGRRPARPRVGVSIWFVIPLVSYSILATTLIGILWFRLQTVEVHPLIAFLPDAEGDAPGVVRKLKAVNDARKRRLIGEPLPDELKLRPGETRIVGALAVTAEGITREQIGVGDGSNEPMRLDVLSLVLHLRVENVSTDESFQPLDRFFDRRWREGSSTAPPLTLLEAGPGLRFFGGPATWQPRRPASRDIVAAPEFIYLMRGDKPVADPIDRPLGPGESSEVFVCTDGNDPRSAALLHHRGDFLWRVHLRRGLVRVSGRDVPAAAVIGVAFTDRDIGDG